MSTPLKAKCRVASIIGHGDHVYSVELVPESMLPRFKAGQFMHLALDSYDPAGFWPESRVFSIASPVEQRDKIQITYSVRGKYTARMERELSVGKEVWVKMPYGDFIVDGSGPVVLIAGGTGITAFTAFLSGMDAASAARTTLIYGAHEPGLLVYRPLVESCRKDLPGFLVFYFTEDTVRTIDNDLPGQIEVAAVWENIPDKEKCSYYLSGPPAMLKSVSTQLRGLGIMDGSIYVDAWE